VAAVQWDHEKPKARLKEQEEQLREYVAHHLYPYSPYYRRRFDAAAIAHELRRPRQARTDALE
jgi:phenylacetate-coenzyme A ligase PaaK-like adenylate-forming protein